MNGPVVVGYLLAIAAGAWAVYLAWRRDAPEPVELDRCDSCDDLLPGDGSAFTVWRAASDAGRFCSKECVVGRES